MFLLKLKVANPISVRLNLQLKQGLGKSKLDKKQSPGGVLNFINKEASGQQLY